MKYSIDGRGNMLPGIHKVRARGRLYYYAWRGGPALPDPAIDPAAFAAAYARARREAGPRPNAPTIAALARAYQASPEWAALSRETQRVRTFRLNAIVKEFGALPLAGVAGRGMRARIIAWRDTMADRPRAADDHIEALNVLFNWGADREKLTANPAKGVKRLYAADRSHITFTDAEIAALTKAAPPALAQLILAARWTGLRLGDLCDLRWRHIDLEAGVIEKITNKSRRSPISAYMIILPPLRPVLIEAAAGRAEHDGYVFLRNGAKWRADLASDAFQYCKSKLKISKHFHDLRGNAATSLVAAGMDADMVDEWMGWKRGKANSKRRYIDRAAVARAVAARIPHGRNTSEIAPQPSPPPRADSPPSPEAPPRILQNRM